MREQRASNIFSGCKRDLEKMAKHHLARKRFFVLYDVCPDSVFLSTAQMNELQSIDPACVLLMHPMTPNDSWQKKAAAAAIETLRAKGYDFSKQGKLNAAKAIGKEFPTAK